MGVVVEAGSDCVKWTLDERRLSSMSNKMR